jgi:NAD+ diphosphatase
LKKVDLDYSSVFSHCGKCGSSRLVFKDGKRNECLDCEWVYYQNPVAAVVAVIFFEQQLLMLRRAIEPGKGLLDLPGGFVNFGETAEEALKRELKEELKINSVELTYLTSSPNDYLFFEIPYQTLDSFFIATLSHPPIEYDQEEIQEICWKDPGLIDPDEVAFPSMYIIIRKFLKNYSSDARSLRI